MSRAGKPRIWLVRHGLSVFNYWSRKYGHRAGELESHSESDTDYEYLATIKDKHDVRLADPELHRRGVAQAEQAQALIHKMNIRQVFVSPLKRTLATCHSLLATYPLGQVETLRVQVHPLLREQLGNPCDVPVNTLTESKSAYESRGYDFSLLENFENPDLFFVYSLNRPERELLFEAIAKDPNRPYLHIVAEMMKKGGSKAGKKLEDLVNVRARAAEFADYLLDFVARSELGDCDDVLIVSHSLFISCCLATEWTSSGQPLVPPIPHCEPIRFEYEQLFRLQAEWASKAVSKLAVSAPLPSLHEAGSSAPSRVQDPELGEDKEECKKESSYEDQRHWGSCLGGPLSKPEQEVEGPGQGQGQKARNLTDGSSKRIAASDCGLAVKLKGTRNLDEETDAESGEKRRSDEPNVESVDDDTRTYVSPMPN